MAFSCSFAQEKDSFNPKFRAAKMYVNSEFKFSNDKASNFVSLLRTFSPSIAWGREYGNFHEVLIQDMNISFNNYSNSIGASVDYSYNLRVGKFNPERKVNFYAGGGIRLGGGYSDNYSNIPNRFNERNFNAKLDLVFTPRMNVKIGKRSMLEVSFPYSVYSTNRYSNYTDNPSVPVENRKEITNSSATFPNQFTVRVGVAIKF